MPVTYPGTTGGGGNAGIWRPIVRIDGSDVSSRIVGELRIDAEEGSARIAELTIRPIATTTFTVAGWVGKSVEIDIADYATGSPASITRLFTGIIDTPALNLVDKTIGLLASDNLQNDLSGFTRVAIAALIIGSYDSPVVFDPASSGWAYAQDLLSTVPKSLDYTPSRAMRLTNWAPLISPDLAFTDAHILDQSVSVSLSSRNALINNVDVAFTYRFPRVKAEGHPITYQYVSEATISQFAIDGNWFLQRAAVEQAIKAAGGAIESISYIALPTYAIGSWIPGPYDPELCMGFTALVSFDFAQMQDEQYAITVLAANSIAAVGTMGDRLSGALEGQYPPVVAAETNMILWKNDIVGIPPYDTATVVSGYTNSAEVTLTSDTNRAAADAAIETLIAIAKTRIWGSHRRNSVQAAIALNPSVDLDRTISITIPSSISCLGKCRSVTHRMNPETGEARTEFAIAICSVAGTGVSHPETPTSAPAGSSLTQNPISTSPTVVFDYLAAGTHEITITFPAVANGERDPTQIPLTSSYDATLTEDLLTYTF